MELGIWRVVKACAKEEGVDRATPFEVLPALVCVAKNLS